MMEQAPDREKTGSYAETLRILTSTPSRCHAWVSSDKIFI
jgi:hypothetical protein